MSEPQPRPAEPSVGGDQPPKEQSDDADMADPDSDRRRPRESLGEERETKRVRINVLDGEESDEGWRLKKEWVRIHRRPRRDLFSPHDSQGGPKLSDISKRRESIFCSTDGGEWRIVDRWDDKGSENHEHRVTRRRLKICLKSGQEAQDSEILGGCCATVKVRIESTGRLVAATTYFATRHKVEPVMISAKFCG